MAEEYKAKRKKPIWVRILRWILGTILSIALMLGGFCLYLYFRHQINVIDVINQVKILNQTVNVDNLATNQFSDEDLTSAKNKIDNISTAENAVKLSDKEMASYINDTIQTQAGGLSVNIGSSTINLVDYGFAIVQMEFSNIPENSESNKLTDFNIVLKIELKKFKEEKMGKFPLKWIAKAIPNSLYFSCNVEINKTSTGYETVSKYMTINNLSSDQTNSIFKTFDTFLKIGTADNFNKTISDGFVKVMIGENGLYYQLKSQNAATGYSFANDGTNNNFVIYTASTEEYHAINYHDGSSTETDFYNITDNTFAPKTAEKAGYTFEGWYDGEGEDANKVTSIDATQMRDIELYARWSIINYTITYTLNGGAIAGENPTTYTIESETFTLINPTKPHYGFVGWTWENQTTPTNVATIANGSTGNIHFVANFDANAYSITYKDKDDENFSGIFAGAYPTVHRFNEVTSLPTPTKTGYTFNGWYLEMDCDGEVFTQIDADIDYELTFFAKWTINQYTLTLKDGTTTLYTTTQDYGSAIPEQTDPEKTGYTFTGWSEEIPSTMPAEDKIITASFQANQYLLTFDANEGVCDVEGKTITYNHMYGSLPTPKRNGYTFDGWYISYPTEQVTENTVCRTTTSLTVYAQWTIIHYTISYTLNGGTVDGENPTSYTVEDADITLINPTKNEFDFLGWEESSGSELQTTMVILHGSIGNRSYNAIFRGYQKILSVVIDGNEVTSINFEYGQTVSTENLINPDQLGMSGYSVSKWYSDPGMTEEFDETQNYYTDVVIYGSWDNYLTDRVYFYPYLTTFSSYKEKDDLGQQNVYEIESRDKLVAYFDYVRFYNITKQFYLKLTYGIGNSISAVRDELLDANSELNTKTEFQSLSRVSYSTPNQNGQICCTYFISTDNIAKQASKIMDENKENVYTQKDYAFKKSISTSSRTFNINNVTKELQVETSEQLVWALENGYKPIYIPGSDAERIYAKAQNVLSQICNNAMSNYQKVRAIYEWLILNVQYDNLAAYKLENNLLTAAEAKEYNSWYVEGVLDNGVAVCEGIAKTFVLLAKIENIPAVMVVNDTHAWNKVYLDGKWYGIDATHGNILDPNRIDTEKIGEVRGIEILLYNQFLFTDEFKTSVHYTATNYTELVADTVYNYYANTEFEINDETFDLQIDSEEELALLLQYVKSVKSDMITKQYTFEFSVNSSITSEMINNWLYSIATELSMDIEDSYGIKLDSSENVVYIFFVNKVA